ncbi:KOW domain-containing RNA-binding protein [Lawsonibacter celer]|jgi:hypothetical protein|uniref:KOW domain-containing RNA-binding protein n=1 Tax=Lawsonibacter celer TaxID=2986526 RepID=UPI00164911B2|nr:KOW domain-containing RNA-binding protein [Lawsonibacter celer]
MEYAKAQIVQSLAGHDKGDFFCVLDAEGGCLLLCDGKRRRTARPKRKKAIHVAGAGEFQHPVLEKIQAGEEVSDSEIRKALAAFRAQSRRV